MKLQTDFINEVTLLQFHAAKLDISVDRTLESAGEGIGYAWALAKLKYQRAPIGEKRSKENFRKLVAEVTNPLGIRSCSRKVVLYETIQSDRANKW